MKTIQKILPGILIWMSAFTTQGQEIPLFSQKLTNSFMYNPALAGHRYGSVTFAHRSNFRQVDGNNNANYLSFQMPLMDGNIGVGANLFNEKINFLNNTYASAAFSYHIDIDQSQYFSMGVSIEYNILRPDFDKVVGDISDNLLLMLDNGGYDKVDFSTGLFYQHPYFEAGVAINRLTTLLASDNDENILSGYYTAHITGLIPLRSGEDLLEPTFAYRRFSKVNNSFVLGLFYTYHDLILLGTSARFGMSNEFETVEHQGLDVISLTAGVKVIKKLLIGFSYDLANKSYAKLGAGSEITLRYDFVENNNMDRFRKQSQSPANFSGHAKKSRYKKR